jgi:hypothetical protein
MLGKLILLGLTIWLILRLIRHYHQSIEPPKRAQHTNETMVQCAFCGIHAPRSECIAANGKYYCCEDHRDKASA